MKLLSLRGYVKLLALLQLLLWLPLHWRGEARNSIPRIPFLTRFWVRASLVVPLDDSWKVGERQKPLFPGGSYMQIHLRCITTAWQEGCWDSRQEIEPTCLSVKGWGGGRAFCSPWDLQRLSEDTWRVVTISLLVASWIFASLAFLAFPTYVTYNSLDKSLPTWNTWMVSVFMAESWLIQIPRSISKI